MADCFVGRQPIIDIDDKVFAYDLLYRGSLQDSAGDVNLTAATSRVIVNTFVDIGFDTIVGRHRAVLNVTESFLAEPSLACFPPERVIIGLPETTFPSEENVTAIRRLKDDGFQIAINGFRTDRPAAPLIQLADLVKIDALDVSTEVLAVQLAAAKERGVLAAAKRVETMARRAELAELGFDAFQGRFLARPEVVSGRQLPTNRMAVLQLVIKLSDPDIHSRELETLIAMDPTLTLRILRFVNSPLSGLKNEIDSIHHAIVMAGREMIKTWAMLLAIASLSNSIQELITAAFVRARFCEQLSVEARLAGKDTYFTVGLFSMMDSMLGMPMHELVGSLPFIPEIKSALIERSGVHGAALDLVEKLEAGAPDGAAFEGVTGARLAELYLDAIAWSDATTSAVS